ncbi:MAG: glycosyltransferase [Candidatus Dormibacteria bacterium]
MDDMDSLPARPRRELRLEPGDYAFCTIATPARTGHATVLTSDLAAHHPGTPVFVLRLGEERIWPVGSQFSKAATILSTDDVGITLATLGQLKASRLSDEEYLLALRPWLLRTVLARGAVAALFVADDVHVLGSLQAMAERAATTGAAFVRRSPVLQPSSAATLCSSVDEPAVDPDLLAVGRAGASLLARWQAESVRSATEAGVSADDFLDRVADEFTDAIITEPRFNLGWWNLSSARDASGGASPAAPLPVTALHLHGFDERRPHLVTAAMPSHLPLRLSEWPWLASLCRQYAQRVLDSGPAVMRSATEWASEADAGAVLLSAGSPRVELESDRFTEECLRRARQGAAIDRCPSPPDPASCRRDEWLGWLNSPPDGSSLRIGRYLTEVYRARPDLQVAFPDLVHEPGPFLRWAGTHGRRELDIPGELLAHPKESDASRSPSVPRARLATAPRAGFGVNVIGLMGEHLGLGEAARQLLSALQAAGVPFRTHQVASGGGSRLRQPALNGPDAKWFPINVICLNPPELQGFQAHVGRNMWDGRYNVGVWVWETETVPRSWRRAANLVDEVWVPSDYVRSAFTRAVNLPIFTVPHAVPVPTHPRYMDRQYLGLPDRYTFLFLFDFSSSIQRKNPLGLVRAFQQAFAPAEGPRLVIKTLHGDRYPGDFEELLLAVGARDDIVVFDRVLTSCERAALLDASDCYVSLHRAEGFGLTMAEAMALGKPVIATGYSGNLEYMTPQNSYLVSYRRARVGVDWDRYPAEDIWAEPDLAAAAALLRAVWEDQGAATSRGARAKEEIARVCSPEVVGTLVRQRLEAIWAEHRLSESGCRSLAARSLRRFRRVAGRVPGMPRST